MLIKVTCKTKKKKKKKTGLHFFRDSLLFLHSLVLRISNKSQLFELCVFDIGSCFFSGISGITSSRATFVAVIAWQV